MAKKPVLYFTPRDGERERTRLTLPERDDGSVSLGVDVCCPSCGVRGVKVSGRNKRISQDDIAYESDAYCTSCREFVGELRLEVSTLFGLREDHAVLYGRCRVY
jgi:hypothetical protein